MKRVLSYALLLVVAVGCNDFAHPVEPGLGSESPAGLSETAGKRAMPERPFKMSNPRLDLAWGIERDFELDCGGDEIAGGEIDGVANLAHLGRATIALSAAWDIGQVNPNPGDAVFSPVGPAGGPFAPVLEWPDDYPYDFQFDPFTQTCSQEVSATGELVLTAANGDEIEGRIAGGETHRLDFPNPLGVVVAGSGVETFAIIDVVGGTGRFSQASGSFVVHTITRFDFIAEEFVIDLAEILPGGTIAY